MTSSIFRKKELRQKNKKTTEEESSRTASGKGAVFQKQAELRQ